MIVTGFGAGVAWDKAYRVYMNSEDDLGMYYEGSVVYPDSDKLPVAFGAYLDITGICSVNLTAKNITIDNNLYRYWTMILATDNTAIPLTVEYPNQYRSTVSLDGKDYYSVESTAKSHIQGCRMVLCGRCMDLRHRTRGLHRRPCKDSD
jgi:hypothetical protein